MLEKNIKKQKAKQNRAFFEGNLGTITHKDDRHPDRNTIKQATRKSIEDYENALV